MTQVNRCACMCREHLQNRNLLHVFDQTIINHYIQKHKAAQGNAYIIAIKTADMMIAQYKPSPADDDLYDQIFQ